MKNLLIFVVLISCEFTSFSQREEVGPLMSNPQLHINAEVNNLRINEGTFDSTFIYKLDVINLPVFDEFSSNKFQKYEADYSDAGVVDTLFFQLLDVSEVPLAANVEYTQQITFYRTVDITEGTVVDVPFIPTQIKIGDLESYPVSYVTTDVYPPFYIYDTVDFPNPIDTVWLVPDVFQDSATQFWANVNDPELIWADSQAYHNYTLAVDPWSLGVVSFDGLDEKGYPYQIGTTITNYADNLTTKPIDMSSPAVEISDSIYLSFLYQTEGFGDVPETGDSLILEFYAKDLDQWNWIWSTNGSALSEFKNVHIKVDSIIYFQNGFKFRFRNYGGLSGSLDHFHIDYVDLRPISSPLEDTIIRDFAIVYPVTSLLETYSSVPWDHYKNNSSGKMNSMLDVVVRNSNPTQLIEQDGSVDVKYNGTIETTHVLSENLLNNGDLNYFAMTTYFSFHDFSSGPNFDNTKPGPFEIFDIVTGVTHSTTNFPDNDSTTSQQIFKNYYSYDDGSAESAYGPTGVQARLAIKYTPYEADSLIGARIHFVPSVTDVSNKLFLLTVWDDNNGVPGNVIYEDDVFFPRQPIYASNRDIFKEYYFIDTQKVHVAGTFYIGWRQFDQDRLNVGLDRNEINNDKTFFSVDDGISWSASGIEGSVMINPIFSTSYDASLGIVNKKLNPVKVSVFPNPATNEITVDVLDAEFEFSELINLQGIRIGKYYSEKIDISNLPAGIYFVKVNGIYGPFKIIKQ